MLKLNVGCGKRNFGKDWVHIDGGDFQHVQNYPLDNLPYANNTVDLIYASHVLEYFDRKEAFKVLSHWYSILKPKGVLRLAVPDFNTIVYLYIGGKYDLDNFVGPLYGKIKMGNLNIYHKTVYDFKSLNKLVLDIGFKNMKLYDWRKTEHAEFDDHSQAYLPHMDKNRGTLISLNVEAIK